MAPRPEFTFRAANSACLLAPAIPRASLGGGNKKVRRTIRSLPGFRPVPTDAVSTAVSETIDVALKRNSNETKQAPPPSRGGNGNFNGRKAPLSFGIHKNYSVSMFNTVLVVPAEKALAIQDSNLNVLVIEKILAGDSSATRFLPAV